MSATDARYGSMSRSAGSAKGLPGRGWPRARELTPPWIRTPCARELQARRQENHEEWSGVRPSRIRHPAMCSFRGSLIRACRCAHDRSRSREPGTAPPAAMYRKLKDDSCPQADECAAVPFWAQVPEQRKCWRTGSLRLDQAPTPCRRFVLRRTGQINESLSDHSDAQLSGSSYSFIGQARKLAA